MTLSWSRPLYAISSRDALVYHVDLLYGSEDGEVRALVGRYVLNLRLIIV
jgi:hypothetical protein